MNKTTEKTEGKVAEKPEVKVKATYSKSTLLSFKRYANRVDLLGALLKDGVEYTLEEVDAKIEKFMKG